MSSCVRNIHTKNYKNLVTGFQVTIENVRNVFGTVYNCATMYLKHHMHDRWAKKAQPVF